MADDILREVSQNEIPQVLEALRKDWPKHFLLHQYITIMEEHKDSEQKFAQVLYRYGSIENGVYIVQTPIPFVKRPPQINFFVYTPSNDLTGLATALAKTSQLPWKSMSFYIELIMSSYTSTVQGVLASQGLTPNLINNFMLWLPPEQPLHVRDLPADVYTSYLDESHAQELDSNWPHSFPESERFLATEIINNFGLGLFRKKDNKLLSSALSFHSGGIFVLFTDVECRGRGYAKIIIQQMAKEIRQRGKIPFATILLTNIASQQLFKKVGFQEYGYVDFLYS